MPTCNYCSSYSRIKLFIVSMCLAAASIVIAAEKETILQPLVKFDSSDAIKSCTFYAWGGEKQSKISLETASDGSYHSFLRLEYQKSSATLGSLVSGTPWQGFPITGFYLRYRVNSLDGRSQYQYNCTDGKEKWSYFNEMGLVRDGQWHLLQTRPGGWCKTKQRFDFKQLQSFALIFHGSGSVDIAEFGMIMEARNVVGSLAAPELIPIRYQDNAVVKVDGNIDEPVWSKALPLTLLDADGKPVVSGNTTQAMVTADAQGIYFAARCYKSDMAKLKADHHGNSVKIYEDESVEFSFDLNRTRKSFAKITVNANGCFGGIHNIPDGVKAASKRYNDRWETELFLPWNVFKQRHDIPFAAGINITRNCYDHEKIERSRLATPVWNDVAAFRLAIVDKTGGEFTTPPDFSLKRSNSGRYLIKPDGTEKNMTWWLNIATPGGETSSKTGKIDSSLPYIPVEFPVVRSGNYFFTLVVSNKDGQRRSVVEGTLAEQSISNLKALDIDDIALFPVPKIFVRGKEIIALPTEFKVHSVGNGLETCHQTLTDSLRDFYHINVITAPLAEAKLIIGLSDHPEIEQLLQSMKLDKEFGQVKYDGFAIAVTPAKMLIAARDKRGLFYGVNAWLDLVKMTSGDVGPARIVSARVIDWPRAEYRFFHQMMHSFYPARKYDVPFYEQMLLRFPMRFRYNGFLFEFGDFYRWQTVKMPNGNAWTADDFSKVIDFLNARYTPVMPSVQSHGHMDWWILKHDEAAFLREDGDKSVICTRHPDTYKILFGLYDEMWKQCGRNPEYAPKYFFTSLDEVRWKTFALPEDKRCRHCRGIPKNQIYLEHLKKLNTHINEHGAKMMMCTDMINEDHNGLNEFKCAEIRTEIPRDIVMCHWSTLDTRRIPQFKKEGFENWKLSTAYQEDRTGENMTHGYGFAVCTYHWWLNINRCETNNLYGLMAQAIYLNNCWNQLPANDREVWRETAKVYGTHLMRNWSRKPIPAAGNGFFTVDLRDVAMTPVSGKGSWFDCGKDNDLSQMDFKNDKIAGIPVDFAMKDGKNTCIRLDKTHPETTMTINQKAASLILLHAANVPPKDLDAFRNRKNNNDPLTGKTAAVYVVSYEDNTTAEFTANYGWNVGQWQIDPTLQRDIFGLYIADSRYLWSGKTERANRLNQSNDIAIYQYEWVNPYPGKNIKSLRLKAPDPLISYALLAVTGRKTAN